MTESLQAQHLVPTSSFELLKEYSCNFGRQPMSISVECFWPSVRTQTVTRSRNGQFEVLKFPVMNSLPCTRYITRF